jgi:hypothetical protein
MNGRASKVHETVCDLHLDESRMNRDGTCAECQDDLHEAELLKGAK